MTASIIWPNLLTISVYRLGHILFVEALAVCNDWVSMMNVGFYVVFGGTGGRLR